MRTIPGGSSLVYPAYAKINLGLRVLRRRQDGYHDIETVFHRISLHDEVSFAADPDIHLTVRFQELPTDDRNICLKAALMLRERLRTEKGVHLSLEKRIPIGAGLGGGSSDAASVLTGLPRFWGIPADISMLEEIALQIGSDVPYFLRPGSAWARGRGEILDYFDLEIPYAILLCNPGIPITTAWAYGKVMPIEDTSAAGIRQILLRGMREPGYLRKYLRNDFEEPVIGAHPEIGRIKSFMLESGAVYASMSGSGSSVYGFFESVPLAEKTGEHLSRSGALVSITPPHFRP